HDFVRVVAQDGPQAAGEGESFFLIHGNLSDTADLIFHGIFDRDDLVFVILDFIDGGVKSGRLARAGGAGDQDHAIRLADVPSKPRNILFIETDHVERERARFVTERFLVENAQHGVFAVDGRHDRNAEVYEASLVANTEAAILRDATLGDVQLAHDLDARKNRGMPFLCKRLHGELQDAVNAVLHNDFRVARLDMNITGAAFQGGEDHGVHEAHDRAHAGVARELVHGDVFFAILFLADDLEGETFGGLIKHTLRLLGSFEQFIDLRGGGDLDLQLFAEQKRQLVRLMELAGVGHGNHEDAIARIERNKFIAEHQLGGDAAKQVGINA